MSSYEMCPRCGGSVLLNDVGVARCTRCSWVEDPSLSWSIPPIDILPPAVGSFSSSRPAAPGVPSNAVLERHPLPWKIEQDEPYSMGLYDATGRKIDGVELWLDDAAHDHNHFRQQNAKFICDVVNLLGKGLKQESPSPFPPAFPPAFPPSSAPPAPDLTWYVERLATLEGLVDKLRNEVADWKSQYLAKEQAALTGSPSTRDIFMVFTEAFDILQRETHTNSVNKGFWQPDKTPDGFNIAEKIALMHEELSEALAETRLDGPYRMDKNIPYLAITVELADTVLRIMDLCEKMEFDLSGAIVAKHLFNKTRPFKHGKKF